MSSHRRIETSRVYWLDSLRGLAIIAVVIGHIKIGLMQAGLTKENSEFFRFLHTLLYLVHMPLFAFLFGLNIPAAWEKRKNWDCVRQRILLFLYLYIIWTAIQDSFEVLGSRFSNGGTTWNNVINIVYPLAHLWYLPWMAIVYTSLVFLRSWRSIYRAIFSIVIISFISWISWGVDYPEFYRKGISIAIFAVLGTLIGTNRINALENLKVNILLPLALATSTLFVILLLDFQHLTVPTLGDPEINLQSKFLGILASFTGTAAFVLWGSFGQRIRISFLETIGIYSLQIYLMHLLFTPTLRIGLAKLGIQDPWIIFVVSLVGGIGMPFACAAVFYRQISWMFELPKRKSYQAKHSIK